MKPFPSLLLLITLSACNQPHGGPIISGNPDPNRSLSFMEKKEVEALRVPFTGVTTSAGTKKVLFPLRSNGNDYGKDLLRQHLEAHPH